MENLYSKHGLVSRTYSKKSLIMASIFGSKSKFFMTMSIPSQDKPLTSRLVLDLKGISLSRSGNWHCLQDVLSTSDRRLIELKNQVQRLMEAHLALTQPTQVNKITTPCEIYSGPHDTHCCMENPEQAFVEYVSSRTMEDGMVKVVYLKPDIKTILVTPTICHGEVTRTLGLVSEFMASQDARLSKFKADFKQQQSERTNKIDTVLKAITNRIAITLPCDTTVLSALSYLIIDPQCSSHPSTSINAIKAHFNDAIIEPQQPKEPKPTIKDEFKDFHLNLPVLEVLAYAPIYNAILDKR
ncbi:hypothetical protein Tco_0910064 [Tanacetum coccineum]|uniref:Uncharacterized protein n=1 Tax=Tanacetum coccineum TaxID=301880 RepID=A0ABQ5CY52_9ASTR